MIVCSQVASHQACRSRWPRCSYHPVVKDRRIAVTAVPVQQQVEDLDCGVYSIAAAYNDAMGRNLGAVTYDADK